MFFFYCITILLDIFVSFLSPNFWVTLYFFANLWWFYPQYLGFHHSFIILFFFHWINTLICHFFSDLTKYINVSFALISVHHFREVIKIVISRSLETLVYYIVTNSRHPLFNSWIDTLDIMNTANYVLSPFWIKYVN